MSEPINHGYCEPCDRTTRVYRTENDAGEDVWLCADCRDDLPGPATGREASER